MRRVFHFSGHFIGHRSIRQIRCLAAIALPLLGPQLYGGEFALLSTGFRLHAESHESVSGRVRLFSGGGVTELPAELVVAFEAEDAPAPDIRPVSPHLAATILPVPQPAAGEQRPATTAVSGPLVFSADAARRYSLPEAFVRSVMQVESAFRPEAVSPKGAIGLMQLVPATARALQVDAFDPRQNAEGGAAYLRELLARYEGRADQVLLALAAYNAGPGAVERYHGVPPWPETREYILRVLKAWNTNAANGGVGTAEIK